ncbi:MAG: hypothetical protein R3B51_13045 [Thermodesulfobacteriota bacterium]
MLGSPPPVGIPSELLLNRPDLRALKYSLVAADNRIGQADSREAPEFYDHGELHIRSGLGPNGPGDFLGSLVQPLLDWGLRERASGRTGGFTKRAWRGSPRRI